MEPTADCRAVHRDVVKLRQFQAQFIQGQFALFRHTRAHPTIQTLQLPRPPQIALRLRQKRARFPAQFDHVIDEFRRNKEMPGRLPVTVPFVNKSHDPLSQLHGMWFTH